MTNLKAISKLIVLNCAITVALILMLEGLSSTIIFIRDIFSNKGDIRLAEQQHTKYDKDLGWINIPNKNIKNLYGPGSNVIINSQSLRSSYDFDVTIPPNKIRCICSGDSFTFGYGVDNDETWCSLLTKHNNRIESINMGQPAYGLDQIYLRYVRDGTKFNHDIHIVAFIGGDFDRMFNYNILGYEKPVLSFENGQLVVKNTPVPKSSGWLNRKFYAIESLRTKQLLTGWIRKNKEIEVKNPLEVVRIIFKTLNEVNKSKKSTLVLVYLPTKDDLVDKFTSLRKDITEMSEENNWNFIDLTDDFKKIPLQKSETLFIQDWQIAYSFGAGHYTPEGNRYVASLIYDKLTKISKVNKKLMLY